jgi:hypothetical protein
VQPAPASTATATGTGTTTAIAPDPDRPDPSNDPASPETIYQRRIDGFGDRMARLARWDDAIVWARTVVFLGAVVWLVLAIGDHVSPRGLLVPAALFIGLVIIHDRVLRGRDRLRAVTALCEAGLDRIRDRWAGKGDPGAPFQATAEEHLYAADLDLFGKGGLYELLSVARTPIGQVTLAGWLQAPAPAPVVRARQGAVAELAPRVDLRQDLALVAATVKHEVREEALMAWAVRAPFDDQETSPTAFGRWRVALGGIAVVTVSAAALWSAGVLGPWPFVVSFVVGAWMSRRLRGPIAQIIASVDHRADELAALAALMARLERETFQSPALRALRQALETDGVPPSHRIAQLRRLVNLLEGRRNQMAALLMAPLQATAQLALAVEAWRRKAGPAVLRWMTAVGEIEALCSLATFQFEHPAYPFPTIIDLDDARPTAPGAAIPTAPGTPAVAANALPQFESEALGHPLIPADRRIVNDVRVGGERRLVVVSGSNMSGKSTLLRTVGVNTVLALAGAPVCARRLALCPVTVGATLRINDSLQAGKSRFYAELTRLKQIVDRAHGTPPLLFLLDEILHGTNSHDRRIGAEAILRGLVARGAAGLVTTHDLALAEVADALGPQAANVHFEDHLEGGVMTFDYRMKSGVVRKSNALELMRAVGLDV